MGDSKNKKVPQKQKASNNSKRNSSSDQKENAPKREKTKTTKPDPDDGIAMSKQLLLKKSHARTLKRTSSKPEKIGPNGKPMPHISVLDKMYGDSDDDDDQTPKTTIQNPKRTPSTPEKRTLTSIIDKDSNLPPSIDKITERLLGSIQNQNLPSPDEVLEAAALLCEKSPPRNTLILPPKKRKIPEVPYIVGCKDRPQVAQKPSTNFCKGDDDYGVEGSARNPEEETPAKRAKKSRIPNYTKSIFNAQSDAIAERLIKDDTENLLSDASSDSNKTIEYDPTPLQNPRPLSFSPLPSTSTDKKTFQKNDELFNESLKEIIISKDSTPTNANDDINDQLTAEIMEDDITLAMQSTPIKKDDALIKEETKLKIKHESHKEKSTPNITEDEIEIIEIPYDTIEIEDICDRTVEIQSTTSKAIDNDDIEIIESVGSEVVKPKENNNIVDKRLDDDDCMIITSTETKNCNNNVKNLTDTTIVIDDEYSSINMEFDSFNVEPIEIIDVDDIIAENNSILHKWKNNQDKELSNINTVVDVPNTYRNVSTPQTTVTPSMAVQTTSSSVTASTTLSAEVTTPGTTFLTPSTSTPNYNFNMTNRDSATNAHNYQMQTSSAYNSQRSARFQSILDDFFQSLRRRAHVTSINESGSRLSSLLNTMVNRLQSPDYTRRPTSNQTQRPTSNPAPIPTSSTVRTPSHPVSTMADTTSVFQNSISTLQNADSGQRDLRLNNSSSNYETHQTSMTIPSPSTIPTRNIGDCPICLDPLNSSNGIASTICGHVFCLSCIQASVKTNGKKCPTCRKALKGAGGGFHLLYL